MTPTEGTGVTGLVTEYEALLLAWDTSLGTAQKANRLFDQAHKTAVQLRSSPEGQEALVSLLAHESPAVRLVAASESLPFAPRPAMRVLREVASSGGLHGLSAATTLREHEAGRLNMDW